MLFQQPENQQPFGKWIWQNQENRLLLIITVVLLMLQFAIFKYLYPLPNFMPPDSNAYVDSAAKNEVFNMWAIGYSMFLRLVSCFSSSAFVLVLLQYLLLQGSLLHFLFSVQYFLGGSKWGFRLVLGSCVLPFNILVLHISNFVSSDALFAALSLVWITQLLWIICRPTAQLLIWHGMVLLLAFMVRYNALFYPFISIGVIIPSHLKVRVKLMGIGWMLLLLSGFTVRTAYQYYKDTHTVQYSAFGGWQMAANALYGYAHSPLRPPEQVPAEFRDLHALVNRHMDSIKHIVPRPDQQIGIYYLWDERAPLMRYMHETWKKDTSTYYLFKWASMGPLYGVYGRYLTMHYPAAYLRYYAWPNLIRYYVPPVMFMGSYNLGMDRVDSLEARWFGWKNQKVYTRTQNKAILITSCFPIPLAIINLVFVLSFITFSVAGGLHKSNPAARKLLCWVFIIWLVNMVFSVVSAPTELRYQLFPMFITFTFCFLLLEYLLEESRAANTPTPMLTS
jgi:hypothetical protein